MDAKTAKKRGYKVVKNRQRPEMCFSYEKQTEQRKYTLFTMNGGTTFLVTIKERNERGYFVNDIYTQDKLYSVSECEQAIKRFEASEVNTCSAGFNISNECKKQ